MNDVPEGAYPFTTIDPSVGETYVRVECAAPEFDRSCTPETGFCRNETRSVPTKLVDGHENFVLVSQSERKAF